MGCSPRSENLRVVLPLTRAVNMSAKPKRDVTVGSHPSAKCAEGLIG
jgi:hypothetical protein